MEPEGRKACSFRWLVLGLVLGLVMLGAGLGFIVLFGTTDMLGGLVVAAIGFIVAVTSFRRAIRAVSPPVWLILGLVMSGAGLIVLGVIIGRRAGPLFDLGPFMQGLMISLAGLVFAVIGLIVMVISLVRTIRRRRADRSLKG